MLQWISCAVVFSYDRAESLEQIPVKEIDGWRDIFKFSSI